MSAALLGLFLGLRHALDPDHVAAVGTILTREASLPRAARIGALWGLGHSATLLAVGGALLVTRAAVPPRVALALEGLVVVMLLALGWRALRAHPATPATPHRPIVIGTVHGLAGSAGVALLVMSAVRTPGEAAAYLALFAGGTVLGMVAVTAALAAPCGWAMRRGGHAAGALRALAGAASIAVALVLARELVAAW